MDYFINEDTGNNIFFHGSREGIFDPISPFENRSPTDFGNGFYLGTKEIQTLARVSNESRPFAYEFKIPQDCITDDNTLMLGIEDWLYFILYNRGLLEDVNNTKFYDYMSHLADGTDFIIGPIADDVYDECIKDFQRGNITDYTFKQLIDCFQYGTQIAVKSVSACSRLIQVNSRELSKMERKEIINRRIMTKNDRFEFYQLKKQELNAERKGLYLFEIKNKIRSNVNIKDILNNMNLYSSVKDPKIKNIKFPKKIHSRKDVEREVFR